MDVCHLQKPGGPLQEGWWLCPKDARERALGPFPPVLRSSGLPAPVPTQSRAAKPSEADDLAASAGGNKSTQDGRDGNGGERLLTDMAQAVVTAGCPWKKYRQ